MGNQKENEKETLSDRFFDGDALRSSKYFKRFERLGKGSVPEGQLVGPSFPMKLGGDIILIEKLPKVERVLKVGGIDLVVGDATTHKHTYSDDAAEFGLVLMVGPGQYMEDGSVLKPETKPGDVILLSGRVDWYSQFGHMADYEPYTIGRIRDSEVFMWFNDYKKAVEILNEKQ